MAPFVRRPWHTLLDLRNHHAQHTKLETRDERYGNLFLFSLCAVFDNQTVSYYAFPSEPNSDSSLAVHTVEACLQLQRCHAAGVGACGVVRGP